MLATIGIIALVLIAIVVTFFLTVWGCIIWFFNSFKNIDNLH